MKILILFLAICVLLSNCDNGNKNENQVKSYTLEPIGDSIYIKLGKKELNQTILNQYFTENDSNYLSVLNEMHNSINIYNLDRKKLIKVLKIDQEGTNAFPGIFGYVIKNLDTIILISNIPSRIGIINGQGKVMKKISYEKDENGKMLFPGVARASQKGILTGNILNLIQVLYDPGYNGKLTSNVQEKINVAISIDIVSGKVNSVPLIFPKDLVGKDIFNMSYCWVLGYHNCFVYIFSVINDLFVTQNFSEFKKTQIETDYDLKLPENMFKYKTDFSGYMKYLMNTDEVWNIHFDMYRECYYVLVRKRSPDTSQNEYSRTFFAFPECFIIILDKDFKHLGDVYFPEKTYSFNNLFITKEGVYISEDHVDNKTFSEDAMRFRLFKLKKI